LLDTDTCSYIMKRSSIALLAKVRKVPLAQQAVSVITAAELLYGVRLSSDPLRVRAAFDAFISHVATLEWTLDAAEAYADIRADLKVRGEMIGANDLLIAAHARSLKATLVTNNTREFRRVKHLKVENWAAATASP
jgi:tRNA(fMet)-specific endonuclease VapC